MELIPNSNYERKRVIRATLAMLILFSLIVAVFLLSMDIGIIRLTPLAVFRTLMLHGTDRENLILFDFRLPRIVISVLVGAGLALSGCILQAISRNALADPGIMGINSGAGLVVVLFISFYPTTSATPVLMLPFLAFGGAAMTAALIYTLAYKRQEGTSPVRLVLIGVAVAAAISAAMLVLTLRLNPNDYQFVATWLAGSIWATNWQYVLALLPWLIVLIPYACYKAGVLNVLSLGESMAVSLGIAVERERLRLLATAVALAGACVAVGGSIGFVGLVGPHLARRLVGGRHQFLLPVSALCGALMLIIADTLARSILEAGIPTGIVVAIIGAPYFLYLLARTN